MKVVVGGFGAIILQIVPIEMMVVDEGAIEDDAAVRLERTRNHVGRVSRSSPISGRAEPPLRVRLHHEAAEVRNVPVDLVDLLPPPLGDPRIERIKRV